jgi:NADH dehydrogenase FAD-containing subunit
VFWVCAVTEVTATEITILCSGTESTETLLKSGESTETLLKSGASTTSTIRYGVCVWACGNGPRPICRELIQAHQTTAPGTSYTGHQRLHARILVDPWLRMIGVGDGSVFALGDCAESEEEPLPQTAQVAAQQGAFVASRPYRYLTVTLPYLLCQQVAAQQGAFVAHLLNDDAPPEQYGDKVREALEEGVREGDEVARALAQSTVKLARPFEFLSLGILAYVGNRKAIAQVLINNMCIYI